MNTEDKIQTPQEILDERYGLEVEAWEAGEVHTREGGSRDGEEYRVIPGTKQHIKEPEYRVAPHEQITAFNTNAILIELKKMNLMLSNLK